MDVSGNLVLANVVDSFHCCWDIRCSICQDGACGKARSKKEQSCESKRSQWRDAASARWLSLQAKNVIGAAIWYSGRSQEQSLRRVPAAEEVLLLPLRIH
jgi:hypothetical protein